MITEVTVGPAETLLKVKQEGCLYVYSLVILLSSTFVFFSNKLVEHGDLSTLKEV